MSASSDFDRGYAEAIEELKKEIERRKNGNSQQQGGDQGGNGENDDDGKRKIGDEDGGSQGRGNQGGGDQQDGDQGGGNAGEEKGGAVDKNGDDSNGGGAGKDGEKKDGKGNVDSNGNPQKEPGDAVDKKMGKQGGNGSSSGSKGQGGQKGSNKGGKGGGGKGAGKSGTGDYTWEDAPFDEKAAERCKKLVDQYKNKMTGPLSEFVQKCKKSQDLKDETKVKALSQHGKEWDQKLTDLMVHNIRNRIWQHKRRFKRSYFKYNKHNLDDDSPIIKPGKKVMQDKMSINFALYIDLSGSMSDCIHDLIEYVNRLMDMLEQRYSKDETIEDMTFKFFGFDTSFHENLKRHQKAISSNGGGTMTFEELAEGINKRTPNATFNLIFSDCEFSGVNADFLRQFFKKTEDTLIIVSSERNATVESIVKEFAHKIFFIYSDNKFKISDD